MTRGKARAIVDSLVAIRSMVTDSQAVKHKDIYPSWREGVEITQEMIDNKQNRFRYGEFLYSCIAPHTTQTEWTPDKVPALFVVIDVEHAGTLEDPIPASVGMLYVKDLYYVEDNKVYLCIRQDTDEGTVLHFLPSALVGNYFEAVTE